MHTTDEIHSKPMFEKSGTENPRSPAKDGREEGRYLKELCFIAQLNFFSSIITTPA
jgi:hypothetical protein